jgi:PAS domain S-box-containing protein
MDDISHENIEDFTKIISLIPGHVYYKDRNGVFIWCNNLQLQDLGLSIKEYIGKTDYDLFSKEDADLLRKNDLEVMNSGIPSFFEEPLPLKDGTRVVYLSQKIPLKDDNGIVVGLLGMSLDITDRKTKEIKLEKEREETEIALDNIINNLPGHVYWKDNNGAILGCNEKQFKSAGLSSKEEIIGKTDYDLPWKENADELRRTDLEVISTGGVVTSEEPSTLADGKAAIFLSKKIPLRDKQNNIIGILGISFDITAEKEAEKLRLEKKVLEEQEEVSRLLAASMAHELRTPLRVIESGLEGIENFLPELLQTYQTARAAELDVPYIAPMHFKALTNITKNMRMETRAAFSVVDMLLVKTNLSKLNAETYKTCSIAHCVNEALTRYPLHTNESEKIHWKKEDFLFFGDETLMTHVIFNLLKNALHYVKAAGKGDIQIWCDKNENFNILHFKDTSQGIDPDILPHIFERFYTRTRHGTGVGLAFCKLVMQSFGGDIICDSIKGEYSDFTLYFPHHPRK